MCLSLNIFGISNSGKAFHPESGATGGELVSTSVDNLRRFGSYHFPWSIGGSIAGGLLTDNTFLHLKCDNKIF